MSAVKIKENIYWVGAIDREVRSFHGYLTPYGSTYNAYLVLDDKITLIDTVKAPFTEELIDNIKEIIDPEKIDCLIVNHVEPDHSGALPKLVSLCKNAQIVTSPNGKKGLNAYYGDLGEMRTVKTGETLTTGKYTFRFVLMPMVHWPDSMSTYLNEEQILFSNDAFGQHIASDARFDDEIGVERLLERAQDYYANIVLPFGSQVQKLIADVSALPGLSVICPSHGVVLRSFIGEMAEKYADWSAAKCDEKKAVIVFDSMWGATRQIARNIAEEYAAKGIACELLDMDKTHVSTAMAALLDAKYICVGSPTLNRNVMPTIAAFLTYMRGLNPKNRAGRAFGAYGWSGESVGQIEEVLKALSFELEPAIKVLWK